MARIKTYAQDANINDQDRILGTSFEGVLNNKPIYKTRNYRLTDLAGYFSQNFDFEGVNYNLSEIDANVTAVNDYFTNLANSLGSVNQDGSLANISIDFANDLVATISTVPDTFTTLALSNLSAIPQAFADFLFTIADINEAFANQVLDLATSTAYATVDQFNTLSAFTTQIDTNVTGLQADFTNLSSTVDTNTGAITANATSLTALGVRVTTAEADVVALNSNVTLLSTTVNTNTGDIATNATNISTLGTVVDTATVDIATLKTDVVLLESSINTNTGNIAANASDISLLTTNVNTTAADVTALQTDVTALTTTVNQNTGDIATTATQVSLLTNRVTTAESNILNTQTDVTSLTTTVNGNTGDIATNASDISILQTNVSTAQADITGIITDISQIETNVNNNTGDISANATAITGLGTRVTTAEADIVNVAGTVTTLTTTVNGNTGAINTNALNISTLSTTVTNNYNTLDAAITTVDNARISGDSALSSSITSLTATVNGNTSSITTNANAISTVDGKLSASYGITVDAGGRVAGLKLLADGTTGSEFIARANTFAVDMPNGTRVMTVNSGGMELSGNLTLDPSTFNNTITFNDTSGNASATITSYPSAGNGLFASVTNGAAGYNPQLILNNIIWKIGDTNQGTITGNNYLGEKRINFTADKLQFTVDPSGTNGFTEVFDGVMIQWGYRNATTTTVYQSFPAAFPTACTYVGVTTNRTSKSNDGANYAYSVTRFGFVAVVESPEDFWFTAIGY